MHPILIFILGILAGTLISWFGRREWIRVRRTSPLTQHQLGDKDGNKAKILEAFISVGKGRCTHPHLSSAYSH